MLYVQTASFSRYTDVVQRLTLLPLFSMLLIEFAQY
jgi:hypothetical protein